MRAAVVIILIGSLYLHLYLREDVIAHASGAAPLPRTTSNHDPEHFSMNTTYTWDVRTAITAGFRIPRQISFVPDFAHFSGLLKFSLPAGCADRTAWWQLSMDGTPAGRGSSRKGALKTETYTDLRLTDSARQLTLTAGWNGGASTCPSFALAWDNPVVSVTSPR
jgi:hypothetical protein